MPRPKLKTTIRKLAASVMLVLFPGLITNAPAAAAPAAGPDLWSAHIEPLLKEHCHECHNPTRSKSGLDLTSLQAILRGGERGSAVIPGRPSDSNLYKSLVADADPHMPPGKRKSLAADEVTLIRQWIEQLATRTAAEPSTNAAEVVPASAPSAPRITWQPPSDAPPARVIDRFLELAWKRDRVSPAALAEDRTFVRRVHLDLAGRIPTEAEATEFLRDRARDKRARLVDRLLAGDDYPRHLREVFDPVLMGRRGPEWEERRAAQKWFAFLEDAFRRNRPWPEVVREVIVARPGRPEDRGAVWFLYERENNPQAVAEALAPVVFGVQIKCAQCHDHMVAREIKQAHYWGMVAAFNRSRNIETPAGPAVGESAIGGFVSFANLRKEALPARLIFFNGRRVDETWPAEGERENDSPDRYVVAPGEGRPTPGAAAVPKFSRREAFADAVTRDNPLLARAMVNRLWALFFGRGLVHPVEQMDSKHPASHPELLDWLARDFQRSGGDVKRLVRALCNSRAYQLDTRPPRSWKTKPAPPELFARAQDKPLSAEQLFRSLLVATGHAADTRGLVAGQAEPRLRRAFVRQFPDLFPTEYNATLQQALFLANSELFDQLLAPHPGNLLARLANLPDAPARVRAAFAAVYGRDPEPDELRECAAHLEARAAEPGLKQLLWALLTSAEFQLNH